MHSEEKLHIHVGYYCVRTNEKVMFLSVCFCPGPVLPYNSDASLWEGL